MKILKISREEVLGMTPTYQWMGDTSFSDWTKQKLIAAGFDMMRTIYRDKDKDGVRVYAQKEHEAEDIETAFDRE